MNFSSSKDNVSLLSTAKNWDVAVKDQITDALAYLEKRHVQKIEGSKPTAQNWRTKERVTAVVAAYAGLLLHIFDSSFVLT